MPRKQPLAIVKPPMTWFLVADGRHAQIYTRNRVEKLIPLVNAWRNQFEEVIANEIAPVPGMKWEAESAEQYQVGRNATGMVFESASSARHMSEPRVDVRDEIKSHFARMLAGQLNTSEKSFDRLVLIAPPKMLGEIKKQLSENLLKRVVAEIPKDLTHYDARALADHLGQFI